MTRELQQETKDLLDRLHREGGHTFKEMAQRAEISSTSVMNYIRARERGYSSTTEYLKEKRKKYRRKHYLRHERWEEAIANAPEAGRKLAEMIHSYITETGETLKKLSSNTGIPYSWLRRYNYALSWPSEEHLNLLASYIEPVRMYRDGVMSKTNERPEAGQGGARKTEYLDASQYRQLRDARQASTLASNGGKPRIAPLGFEIKNIVQEDSTLDYILSPEIDMNRSNSNMDPEFVAEIIKKHFIMNLRTQKWLVEHLDRELTLEDIVIVTPSSKNPYKYHIEAALPHAMQKQFRRFVNDLKRKLAPSTVSGRPRLESHKNEAQ